jgi:3-hydroxyisobutyrate dehydrogenase
MAANLVKAGFKVTGFDLSKQAQMAASKAGVSLAESAAEAVKGAGTLMTMLPAGKHVISVWAEVEKIISIRIRFLQRGVSSNYAPLLPFAPEPPP